LGSTFRSIYSLGSNPAEIYSIFFDSRKQEKLTLVENSGLVKLSVQILCLIGQIALHFLIDIDNNLI